MKRTKLRTVLIAAGTLAVLAGLTAAIWASGDQPGVNVSSYVDKTPENPEDLYKDRVASDPSKPQPAGQYAKQNQNAPQQSSEAPLTLAGMTDAEVEAFIAQAAVETPEDAEVNSLYWETYKIMRRYHPGRFDVDHMWDLIKNDVAEAAVELYNSGELSAADQETIGLFVYDQINCLAGVSSPYTAAARQIVEEVRNRPGFVEDQTPAS